MPRLSEGEARVLATRAFFHAGVAAPGLAEAAADSLVLAEMMGIPTHGLARVGACVQRLAAGGMDAAARPEITAPAPALRLIDARAALGPGVAMQALHATMEAARDTGMAGAFLRNATHLGALAPLLWTAAEAGFATIVTSNAAPMLAPPGGRAARVGNSPLGIGLPHAGGRHVMLDMALSVAARSKVRAAAQAGRPIPETWATDAEGRPTTDAQAAMAGLMQAIGGPKGAALAVTLDLLAAGLAGAAMLSEVPDTHKDAAAVPNLGQMILVIDAARLAPPAELAARLDRAAGIVGSTPPVAGGPAPRLPGARALAALDTARAEGMDIPPALMDELTRLAG
ncbi:Ldh family oxidoreductase [Roseicyclus persicicus]|uniref:Ldh family oxidoreductase n=1 Tax=Roseicyclus persicicus TaxID=2650661 RepID=A0A7X6GY40_9RHOB|nr:Ldh family oxidoreductase [Roseibacterium persicicum]NKX44540.1 Ldh family oxidoreductase [Roseibacterium persicicum]